MSWYMTALLKPHGAKCDAVSIYLLLATPVLLLCVCPLFPPTFISSVMEDCNWIKSDLVWSGMCCGCAASLWRGWVDSCKHRLCCGLRGACVGVVLRSSHVLLLALCEVSIHANSRSLLHYDHGVAAVHLWWGSSTCQSHQEDYCGLVTVVELALSLETSAPEVSGLSVPIWFCYQFKENA